MVYCSMVTRFRANGVLINGDAAEPLNGGGFNGDASLNGGLINGDAAKLLNGGLIYIS